MIRERGIDFENLFFKTGVRTKNFSFLKDFGTLCDLLIDLHNEQISIREARKEQDMMIKKINELSSFASSECFAEEKSRGDIRKVKTKTQKKQIYEARKRIKQNALMLYDNRNTTIIPFAAKDILSKDVEEDAYQDEQPKFEESIAERIKTRKQDHKGKGLNILTPQQMLSRLPISLAISIKSRK